MTRDIPQFVSLQPGSDHSAINKSSNKSTAVFIILGWLGLFGFAGIVAFIGGIEPAVRTFQLAYALGFIGYFLLALVVMRALTKTRLSHWPWWLVGCLALRIILIATTPSDDIYRYIWEGRIQQAGFNPYAHAPDSPALALLQNDDWKKINHPDYPAIYPPVAQATFLLAATIHPSPMTVKCFVVCCDALVILLLASILRALGHLPHGALLYALCPLVLTSFAVEGHIDSLMLLFTLLSIRAALSKRMNLAAIALGLAISSKLIVIILIPWLFFRSKRAAILAMTVFAMSYLPYASAGASLTESLTRFGGGTSFFSLGETLGIFDFTSPATKIFVAIIIASLISFISYHTKSYVHAASASLTILLLLMPIIHYWYLTWVIVWVPFVRQWRWIAAAAAMVVYFEAHVARVGTSAWTMPTWSPMVVWGCFASGWLADVAIARTKPLSDNDTSPS